jgi:hypothetical protein
VQITNIIVPLYAILINTYRYYFTTIATDNLAPQRNICSAFHDYNSEQFFAVQITNIIVPLYAILINTYRYYFTTIATDNLAPQPTLRLEARTGTHRKTKKGKQSAGGRGGGQGVGKEPNHATACKPDPL